MNNSVIREYFTVMGVPTQLANLLCHRLSANQSANEIAIAICTYTDMFEDEIIIKKYEDPEIIVRKGIMAMLNVTPKNKYMRIFASALLPICENKVQCRELVERLELQCFNYSDNEYNFTYEFHCGEIAQLLLDESKRDVIFRMLKDNIDVGGKQVRDLFPETFQKIYDVIEKRKSQFIDTKKSKIFTCPRCGGRETSYEEKFNKRSIDEESSFEVLCLNSYCGMRFRR